MTQVFKFFEEMGGEYQANILCQVRDNLPRMNQDNYFALQMFLFYWAYERAGASQGYKIAAVKAVKLYQEMNGGPIEDFIEYYKEFYPDPSDSELRAHNEAKNRSKRREGKEEIELTEPWDIWNKNCNPCFSSGIVNLDISQILSQLQQDLDALDDIFQSINLNGIGPKIKSFFFRDIVYLLLGMGNLFDLLERAPCNYLFLMPIDIWVRKGGEQIIKCAEQPVTIPSDYKDKNKICRLNTKDFEIASKLIILSLENETSPLSVNMGIWYFCSKYVQDERRLRRLFLDEGDTPLSIDTVLANLKKEKYLMGIFGGQRSSLP